MKNNKKQNNKKRQGIFKRVISFNFNPTTLIIGGLLVIAMSSFLLNAGGGSENTQISVSRLMNGIKDNQYARLTIRNNGEILAQDKYIYVASNSDQSSDLDVSKLNEVTGGEMVDLLTQVDPLDQIRAFFTGGPASGINELIISDEFVIARALSAEGEDYILRDTDRQGLETLLKDNGYSLADFEVTISPIRSTAQPIAVESLVARGNNSEYADVYILEDQVFARLADQNIATYAVRWDASLSAFTGILQEEGIQLANENIEIGSVIINSIDWGSIISLITIIGLVILGYFIYRGIQNSGSGLMRFGQSKARMFWGVQPDITFKDVAGVEEAKQELAEVVEFLKTPQKFRKLGARIPKGVLMVGQPGTGKTLMARAVAGEAGVPFFHTSGSEFEEMLVGAGASRVRDLFEKAKKAAPALIFIDEIDAVARKRGTTIQSGTTEQTLNQILVEMDGFESETNVIVIAATNRPDVLDPAILRPGRFDRRVVLDLPDVKGREEILEVHAKGKPLADDVELSKVAKRTIGFSGAELENTLNEAAIIAAKHDRDEIKANDIEEAASKVTMGPVRKSLVRSDEELELVAVHEAGHAVVSYYTDKSDPVHRVSILSRGSAGGVTQFLPEKDNRMVSRTKLLSRIIVGLGGRAAEEIELDDISTGASSDIQMVTRVARAMVQKYGMSEKLGLIKYGEFDDSGSMGYSYGSHSQDFSEDTAREIDKEVKSLIQGGYSRAKEIISENKNKFDHVVEALLEKEVLESDEFQKIMEGGSLKESGDDAATEEEGSKTTSTDNSEADKEKKKVADKKASKD